MKISIVTVSYNSAGTIEDTIKSVISQNNVDLEYVIVDGGSTDDTLKIIEKYQDKITKIISEPDKGIYDAMNKGLSMATGEVVEIINSDDFYKSNDVLEKVEKRFAETGAEAVYGDIVYVDRINIQKQVRHWEAGEYRKKNLNYGWIMPHPAFFVKKAVYNKFGLFNLNFKIAADYELMLRFLVNDISISYLPEAIVCMREGGFSAIDFNRRKAGWQELKKAWEINHLKLPKFFIVKRIIHKIKQYLPKK